MLNKISVLSPYKGQVKVMNWCLDNKYSFCNCFFSNTILKMGLVLSERIILFRSTYKSLKDPLFNTGGGKNGVF